jgi:hypothetical protein
MDRVRFGRALGYGARHAVKSLMQAADAATSPDPSAGRKGVVQTRQVVQQSAVQAGKLKRSVWSPLAKFSGVLWLQVTGTFFALIATVLGAALWSRRTEFRMPAGSHEAEKFYFLLVVFVAFAYFAVSNFVRAHRRDRK